MESVHAPTTVLAQEDMEVTAVKNVRQNIHTKKIADLN